jgi:sugar phosphate permease
MPNLYHNRWLRLLPIAFITYSLAYLDRANFSFGVAGGMEKDLQITGSVSSLLGSLFFLGYFFFQIPGAIYADTRSAKKLIFWSLILWGIFAVATGMVSNITMLMVIRFCLGIVESAVMPAMLILLSKWFTKAERSRANTFLILGNPVTVLWMSILSGYLIHNVGWRWMFILEGLPAILWAAVWWYGINDDPNEAKWMTNEDKEKLKIHLLEEQSHIKPIKNYSAAFKSKTVILLCLQYLLWSVGTYGFVMWLPSMVKAGSNQGIINVGWLSAIPYLFAVGGMILASYFSDKWNTRMPFISIPLFIASVAFLLSYLFGEGQFMISFLLLIIAGACLYIPYGPFFAMISEILPRNVMAGGIAIVNSFGALGSFIGAYAVGLLKNNTGSFHSSFLALSLCVLISVWLTWYVGRMKVGQADNLT